MTPDRIAELERLLAWSGNGDATPEEYDRAGDTFAALLAERETLREALRETIPYVNRAVDSDQPWRIETATGILARVRAALEGAPDA